MMRATRLPRALVSAASRADSDATFALPDAKPLWRSISTRFPSVLRAFRNRSMSSLLAIIGSFRSWTEVDTTGSAWLPNTPGGPTARVARVLPRSRLHRRSLVVVVAHGAHAAAVALARPAVA